MSNQNGTLYIVATPIGNLSDISQRALDILQQVNLIAAEDTRKSKTLLSHYTINTPMTAYHEHNEGSKSGYLIEKLQQGESIALISDAGTPLISDPGYSLVQEAHKANISIVPVPGCCALVAALSVSGLSSARFSFDGFLPRTSTARKKIFQQNLKLAKTLIFYESSHRILYCLEDMLDVYGADRKVSLARELTKTFETIVTDNLLTLVEKVRTEPNMQRGEFVVMVDAFIEDKKEQELADDVLQTLTTLLGECSLKTAVSLAVKLTGLPKKKLYQAALLISKEN